MDDMNLIRILLVDDHAMVRAGIRRFLEKDDGLRVIIEADGAAQARELLTLHEIDVVLLDIKMPEINGIELTRLMRADYPELGILVVSAFDDAPFIKAALGAGANGYMLKSTEPRQLIRAVRQVYKKHSVIDPDLAPVLMELAVYPESTAIISQLSDREIEVLQLTGQGKTNKEIGNELAISDRTVQSHLARLFRKLDVNTRTEAVKVGIAIGLISAE